MSRGGDLAGSSQMDECAQVCVTARELRTLQICHFYSKQAAIRLGGTSPRPPRSIYANTFLINSCGKERSEPSILGKLTSTVQSPSGLSIAACPNLHTGTQPRNRLEDSNSQARRSFCKRRSLLWDRYRTDATPWSIGLLGHNQTDLQVVQFSSVTHSCPSLCDPMNRSTPGFPVDHQLPVLVQTYAIQPSHPLSSPSSPAFNLSSIRVSSNESVLHIRWPKYWSFSFSITPSNEYSGLIFFRVD